MMKQLFGTTVLFGGNAPFVEELYENYLDNFEICRVCSNWNTRETDFKRKS